MPIRLRQKLAAILYERYEIVIWPVHMPPLGNRHQPSAPRDGVGTHDLPFTTGWAGKRMSAIFVVLKLLAHFCRDFPRLLLWLPVPFQVALLVFLAGMAPARVVSANFWDDLVHDSPRYLF
jgi:hypothetical protein